ncbi:MAG: signal recognition particle-docking protein FtsY [Mycoplasmataceae bacterium]|nr:signal recognition particle-docking protein FtsY [Mycoplasmataceae bacterium]
MGFFKKLKTKLTTLNIEDKKVVKEKTVVVKKDTNDKKLIKQKKKLDKYVSGLEKSGLSFSQKIKGVFQGDRQIDEELFEELEDVLITSDISSSLVIKIIGKIKSEVKTKKLTEKNDVLDVVVEQLHKAYSSKSKTNIDIVDGRINVIIMVGVNGVGKTTSIAKMAKRFKADGKKVIIAAADTFRAGAVEQLNVWADRVGVDIVKPIKDGVDPSSVVFDAVSKAKDGKYDILIIDTAGRLQNKVNLMNELAKMKKIISREIPDAPHETLLVIDSTTGQNGVSQAKNFNEVVDVTGIVLTKLDGTSRGGIVLTINNDLGLPVKLIGLGEGVDDLQTFDLDSFIYGLTKDFF